MDELQPVQEQGWRRKEARWGSIQDDELRAPCERAGGMDNKEEMDGKNREKGHFWSFHTFVYSEKLFYYIVHQNRFNFTKKAAFRAKGNKSYFTGEGELYQTCPYKKKGT